MTVSIVLTVIILLVADGWDIKTGTIPNYITIPAILAGLLLSVYYGGFLGLKDSFFGAGLGLLLLIIPFALGGIGGGDVKLMAAIGALNGWEFTLYAFLYSAIIGGIMALAISIWNKKLSQVFFNILMQFTTGQFKIEEGEKSPLSSGLSFPYGIAIMIGTCMAYWFRYRGVF